MERFDEYQNWTESTSQYPGLNTGSLATLGYLALGLTGESGEVADKIKKMMRKGDDSPETRKELAKEVGDVLWYLARLAKELGVPLSQMVATNVAKLESRMDRHTIIGEGDNR